MARRILNQCAWAASRKRDSYLSAQFWRLAPRIGKKKAAVAVAHSILVICWHLLTNDSDFEDLGGDYFTSRVNPDKQCDHHIQQLQSLGYRVSSTRSPRTSDALTVDSLHSRSWLAMGLPGRRVRQTVSRHNHPWG